MLRTAICWKVSISNAKSSVQRSDADADDDCQMVKMIRDEIMKSKFPNKNGNYRFVASQPSARQIGAYSLGLAAVFEECGLSGKQPGVAQPGWYHAGCRREMTGWLLCSDAKPSPGGVLSSHFKNILLNNKNILLLYS